MDESGKLVHCVCDDCYEVCHQEAFGNSTALDSVPRHGPSTSATGERSTDAKATGHFQQLAIADFDNFYNDDITMLDQPSQTEMQLSSSQSSSGLPWMASSGNGSDCQEDPKFSTPERKGLSNNISLFPRMQEDIQGRNNPGFIHQGGSSDSSNGLSQGFSSPAKSLEDAYQRLEINYVMLPDPNELQKQALSIISGLSMDRVQAFYAQKHRRAIYRGGDVAQSQETQSLLGIQTVNKEDINFSDSAYYSHSSSGSSGTQNRHKAYELDSAAVSPDEWLSKPLKGQKKAMLKQDVGELDETPKPFECTWRGCAERFRSKRDWRRHEESIHCQQLTWKCPVNVSPSRRNHGKTVCGREFKRDDKFREHLRNAKGGHGYDDLEIGTMVEDVRQPLFPASQFRKECGFCGQYLPTWEIRIDHIADEYTKKGKNMSMWKDPWPRGGGFGSERNDDDEDDDDKDNDDSSDSYGPGNSSSDKNASSKTEPKDRHGGGASQSRDQINDRRGTASHRSHNNSSAGGPLLDNAILCYRIKQQAAADSSAVMATSTSGSSDDEAMMLSMDKKRSAEGISAVLLQCIPGGGKTYLARQYVYKHLDDFTGGVSWVRAKSDEQLADARHKRSARADLDPKRCRELNCAKEFRRPCDPTKHEKPHSRLWKCSVDSCKYQEYGWPTEKELDRHTNDKHFLAQVLYKCQYAPCSYESKRESNYKQHMEKYHGWTYVRPKNNGTCRSEVGESWLPRATLMHIGATTYTPPETLEISRNVERILANRAKTVTEVGEIGWPAPEALALRSLESTLDFHPGTLSQEHTISYVQDNQLTENWHEHTSEEQGSQPILRFLPYGGNDTKPRLSKQEVGILEQQFQEHHKPTSSTKRQLAERFHVDVARINVSAKGEE
jgi:hypothetical protein